MSGASFKAKARSLMLKNASKLFLVGALFLLLVTIISELCLRLPGVIDWQNMLDRLSSGEMPSITLVYREFRPMGVVLALLLYLLQPILGFGYKSYCLKIARGETAEYKDIFNGFLFLIKVLSIFVITSIMIFMWSFLLIIPGIVAAYRYRLSYYILLDDPSKGAFQCIEESTVMMYGSKLDLLIIDLSFLGWYILDFTVILLSPLPYTPSFVLIWVYPYRGLTNVCFYEHRKSVLAV